jgi:diguanylate cyclase
MENGKVRDATVTTKDLHSIELHKAQALAEKTLALAHKYFTPPMPKVYEVIFTYLGRNNHVVNKHIDKIVSTRGTLNLYDFEEIYNNYFCTNEKNRRQNDKTCEQLSSELDTLINLVNRHLLSNKEYGQSLNNASQILNGHATSQVLVDTVNMLMKNNHHMQLETQKLTKLLEESKSQMQKINNALDNARRDSLTDPVTQLGNRRWLEAKLDIILADAQRSGNGFCLAFMDIDHFKQVNDKFGHAAGDQVLRFIASLLLNSINEKHLCARYGGEEFIIIFQDTDISETKKYVEGIRNQLQTSELIFNISKKSLGTITASFGIVSNTEKDDVNSMIRRADEQMYKAKEIGRNCVVCDQ